MATASKKPRVLLVSATTIFGGGEVYYIKLVKLLSNHFEFGAVTFNSVLRDQLTELRVPVWHGEVPSDAPFLKRYLLLGKQIKAGIHDFSPALVHLNGGPEGYMAFVPWIHRVPILITNHIVRRVAITSILPRLALAVSTRMAERTVCVSATAERNLRRYAWMKKTVIIPNWLPMVPEERDRQLYDDSRPFRLLFVGRLEPEKGIHVLIQAMRCLDNVELDVVGDGAMRDEVVALCSGLPVRFHGFQKDAMPFYRVADLLIFPSFLESQGMVLVEAMSCGLPCLASNIEAVLETTRNGQFAETFRCGDAMDLARKIQELRSNIGRLQYLAESGRIHVLKTFSKDRVGTTYLRLFHSMLGLEPFNG